MSKAVIAGYVRSPFHFAGKGALTKVRPDDLAATVVKGLLEAARFRKASRGSMSRA
jgi:acetyl-CoA acyltransferase